MSIEELVQFLEKNPDQSSFVRISSSHAENTFELPLKQLLDTLKNAIPAPAIEDSVTPNHSAQSVVILQNTESELKRALVQPSKMILLAEPHDVTEQLTACLQELRQLTCRALCKAWIKAILPRKQTTNPYRGGDETKPPWWPSSIRHKEPDHLRRSERLSIMVTILLTDGLANVDVLIESSKACYEYLDSYRLSVLYEVFYIKFMKDQDPQHLLEVSDFKALHKDKKIRNNNVAFDSTNVFESEDNLFSSSKFEEPPKMHCGDTYQDAVKYPNLPDSNHLPLHDSLTVTKRRKIPNVFIDKDSSETGLFDRPQLAPFKERQPLKMKDANMRSLKAIEPSVATIPEFEILYKSSDSLFPAKILSSTDRQKSGEFSSAIWNSTQVRSPPKSVAPAKWMLLDREKNPDMHK